MRQSGGWAAGRAIADANRKSLLLKAVICFARGGDSARAVELLVACDERARGVDLLRSVGDMANAARLESDRSGHVSGMGWQVDATAAAP